MFVRIIFFESLKIAKIVYRENAINTFRICI